MCIEYGVFVSVTKDTKWYIDQYYYSPASEPQPKYRTGKNSNYRRFWLFSGAIIGGF